MTDLILLGRDDASSVVSFTHDFLSVALFWIGFVALPCSHCHAGEGKDPSLVKFLEETGSHLLIQYLDKQYSDAFGYTIGFNGWHRSVIVLAGSTSNALDSI